MVRSESDAIAFGELGLSRDTKSGEPLFEIGLSGYVRELAFCTKARCGCVTHRRWAGDWGHFVVPGCLGLGSSETGSERELLGVFVCVVSLDAVTDRSEESRRLNGASGF